MKLNKLLPIFLFFVASLTGCSINAPAGSGNAMVSEPFISAEITKEASLEKTEETEVIEPVVKSVFTVSTGTLKENAERLAGGFGYKPYGWKAKNFMVNIPYSFQYETIDEAFTVLFRDFPVQAQLIETGIPGESAVSFVSRRVVRGGQ